MHNVLVLGGYGFFGSRICEALSGDRSIHLLIGGRRYDQALALADRLNLQPDQAVAINALAPGLAEQFTKWDVNTVVHTAGPFQGQDYAVARAAIDANANYIDLADGRDFVAGCVQLNPEAAAKNLLVTSGASSLPALSSAVVDRYLSRFRRLEAIRVGIGSGARAPGPATLQGVFGYCGKSFSRWENGTWKTTFGWLDTRRYRFPAPVGTRLLGSCDVPDLELFPHRFPDVQTVTFHAGFAGVVGHCAVWAAAHLVRMKLLPSVAPLAPTLHKLSQRLEWLASDKGAMFVSMEGSDLNGNPLKLDWHLIAEHNHGPYIPCGAAIALTRKLAANSAGLPVGAMPCIGLLSVEEYLSALHDFDVREMIP